MPRSLPPTHNASVVLIVTAALAAGMANHCLAGQEEPEGRGTHGDPQLGPPIVIQLLPNTPRVVGPLAFPTRQELASVDVTAQVMALVARLDHPCYREREAATQALHDGRDNRRQLYAVLAREALSAEQRHRLLAVVRQRLLNTPRGALGIRMRFEQPDANQPGEVVIMDLLPGLPAERVLQLGDRITHVDGNPLTARNDLIHRVQARRPGDEVQLVVNRVRRDGDGRPLWNEVRQPQYETLEIGIVLGSAELLKQFGSRKTEVESMREAEADWAMTFFAPQPALIKFRDR
ncbi:MAG: PDZ domain-containing protein [Planctomycetes bacterium]|nr:PDZ domain-containing protein [Planctomycetota bacterium]